MDFLTNWKKRIENKKIQKVENNFKKDLDIIKNFVKETNGQDVPSFDFYYKVFDGNKWNLYDKNSKPYYEKVMTHNAYKVLFANENRNLWKSIGVKKRALALLWMVEEYCSYNKKHCPKFEFVSDNGDFIRPSETDQNFYYVNARSLYSNKVEPQAFLYRLVKKAYYYDHAMNVIEFSKGNQDAIKDDFTFLLIANQYKEIKKPKVSFQDVKNNNVTKKQKLKFVLYYNLPIYLADEEIFRYVESQSDMAQNRFAEIDEPWEKLKAEWNEDYNIPRNAFNELFEGVVYEDVYENILIGENTYNVEFSNGAIKEDAQLES